MKEETKKQTKETKGENEHIIQCGEGEDFTTQFYQSERRCVIDVSKVNKIYYRYTSVEETVLIESDGK